MWFGFHFRVVWETQVAEDSVQHPIGPPFFSAAY